jgi:hypothetical protein
MMHRHLNHQQYTSAALDDVIERGKREDWAQLRSAALKDHVIMEKILRVARGHAREPYAQRYHFWRHYAEQHLKAA